MTEAPLIEVRGLEKHFPIRAGALYRSSGVVRAVDGIDLDIGVGETVGLVGESGSGKTTFGRCLLRLIEPTSGSIRFRGEDWLALEGANLRRRRRHLQMIFQDPYGSLNPRMRVSSIVGEPLSVHSIVPRAERGGEVERLLREVGLPPDAAARYPREFSGGQRQRIGIARALACRPDLIVADEPVSALDVSVQAQVVNLLLELKRRRGLALLFIAHDLAVVDRIADRVAVLYLGRIVESGAPTELFSSPAHPYTAALLSAVPKVDPSSGRQRIVLAGEPPSPAAPPSGCAFHPRCPIARPGCGVEEPLLQDLGSGRRVACHYPGELSPSDE